MKQNISENTKKDQSPTFKVGDVVLVPTVHPDRMCIKSIRGTVTTCTWFDAHNQINQEGFLISELVLVE